MKKLFFPVAALAFVAIMASVSSCKQDIVDRFEYISSQDTMVPVINLSVPAVNQSYKYGNHVAIVGTVTDLESEKNDIHDPGFRKGELKSVSIEVMDLTNGTTLLKRNPEVSGTDGYSINERVEIVTGTGQAKCKLTIVATDASDKTVRKEVEFTYDN